MWAKIVWSWKNRKVIKKKSKTKNRILLIFCHFWVGTTKNYKFLTYKKILQITKRNLQKARNSICMCWRLTRQSTTRYRQRYLWKFIRRALLSESERCISRKCSKNIKRLSQVLPNLCHGLFLEQFVLCGGQANLFRIGFTDPHRWRKSGRRFAELVEPARSNAAHTAATKHGPSWYG